MLYLLTLYIFAMSTNNLSVFFIPSTTLVHMMGKHIKKVIITGTTPDLNQLKNIIIMDITGVDFMHMTKGFNKLYMYLLKELNNPIIIPRVKDTKKPAKTLSNV